jgi:two-component system response regulator FixJ
MSAPKAGGRTASASRCRLRVDGMSERPVHIVDDDLEARQSLALLLRVHGFDARTYASGQSFLDQLAPPGSGCAVLDLRMPRMSGLEVQQEMARRGLTLPVVFVTGHGDVATAVAAMKLGALDFIEKPYGEAEALEAIRRALTTADRDAGRRAMAGRAKVLLERLTPREREVLGLVVDGLTSEQIARRLDVATRTVNAHRGALLEKMQARSTIDLLRLLSVADLEAGSGARSEP